MARGSGRVRKRLVIGGGVALAVVVVGGLAARALVSQPPAVTYLTAVAAVADVVETVSVTGSVRPVETYALAFGAPPVRNPAPSATLGGAGSAGAATWTVGTVGVRAGDRVTRGQVLATADTSDAEAALATAQLSLDAARARLAADSKPVSATARAKADLAVTQANLGLTQARAAQTRTADAGRLAVSQAQAVLAEAKSRLADDQAAGLPDSAIAADQAAVNAAARALSTARQQASAANQQAAAAVETARLNVRSAQLARQSATEVDAIAAIAADRVSVSQAETAVANAKTALERLTLTAPIDGTVSSADIRPGDAVSGVVITLRGTAVEVDTAVAEADLPSIRVGQAATVTVGALGASFPGSVATVDPDGATKGAGGVVSYAVTIALPSPPAGLAPSMTADVDITTARAAGVVAVPVTAVGGTPGAYTVRVYDGPGAAHAVPVEVGLMTTSLAEIRSGLAAGTTVVTGVATQKDLVTTFPGPGGGGAGGAGGTSPATPATAAP